MQSLAGTPQEYVEQAPQDRRPALEALRKRIREHLPPGFEETMQYGMIGYVVPHRLYPPGYHVNPKEPLPFLGLASQKNHISVYHMGLALFPDVLKWFTEEYPRHRKTKLDYGKNCIRFRNWDTLPYELIAQLCEKIAVSDYIRAYEASLSQKK